MRLISPLISLAAIATSLSTPRMGGRAPSIAEDRVRIGNSIGREPIGRGYQPSQIEVIQKKLTALKDKRTNYESYQTHSEDITSNLKTLEKSFKSEGKYSDLQTRNLVDSVLDVYSNMIENSEKGKHYAIHSNINFKFIFNTMAIVTRLSQSSPEQTKHSIDRVSNFINKMKDNSNKIQDNINTLEKSQSKLSRNIVYEKQIAALFKNYEKLMTLILNELGKVKVEK
ncbi:hypothetical protein DID74_00485 [Candidatus Marinamargulisbacteria bacterium SCGC AG-333-B06]|nr:hypothetical protein DID74_00485 [Candidatus Marinamargulisbacteria bacterium SCGC AG-333-B06]